MLCFRNKTYYDFKDCKYFNKCHEALIEQMQKDSNVSELPICKFIDKLGCYYGKK